MKRCLSLLVLYYLRFWAKIKLAQITPIIVGVTGSAGKTSTVAAIETSLSRKFTVKSTGGANSESGIPLSVLGLKMTDYSLLDWLRVLLLAPLSLIQTTEYKILICEMGIDELTPPKNMEYLLSIVQPKIGVFLNVLPVHTMQMKSVENIATEKGKLITSLPKDGTAILNVNDPEVLKFKDQTRAKVITFDGTALGAANAVGKIFDLPPIKEFPAPAGRGRIFPGIHGSTLIDQSYNASRLPMIMALQDLAKYSRLPAGRQGRRVAVLGDMRELGDQAQAEHEIVAREAYKLADVVITVGPLTKKYFVTPPKPKGEGGPQNKKLIAQFDTSYQAGNFLQTFIQPKDVILFKGSQNTIFLEIAVEMCLKNKSDAALLCRRGKFWDQKREEYRDKLKN